MTSSFIHPSLFLIAGALLLPFIQGPLRKPYLFLAPMLALGAEVLNAAHSGVFGVVNFLE